MAAPTRAPRPTMSHTSVGLTVRMLPNRMAKRSALKPRARLISTTASAKPPERNTASPAAPWRGEMPRKSPRATPASATCASVSAMSERRRGTRKTPMEGQMMAVMAPATKARCMKPYSRNSGIGMVSVGVGDDAPGRPIQPGQRGVIQKVPGGTVEDEAPIQAGQLGDLFRHHADVVADQDQGDLPLPVEMLQQGVEARLRFRV